MSLIFTFILGMATGYIFPRLDSLVEEYFNRKEQTEDE